MILHLTPAARNVLRLIQFRRQACRGWVTGTVMGHVWLVDNLIPGFNGNNVEEAGAAAEILGEQLLGEFFAFQPPPQENSPGGGLVLRIHAGILEAGLAEAPGREIVFAEIPVQGDSS